MENDLTRSSLWSVLIFRALPLNRSTLYNLLRCLSIFLSPSPFPRRSKGHDTVLVSVKRSTAHRYVRYLQPIVLRKSCRNEASETRLLLNAASIYVTNISNEKKTENRMRPFAELQLRNCQGILSTNNKWLAIPRELYNLYCNMLAWV